MKIATLCFLIRDGEICLGFKKRGFGQGKYNGFGGKVGDKEEFKGETIEEGLIREAREEFNTKLVDFEKRGVINFINPKVVEGEQVVHIFVCTKWIDEPEESEEIKPEWIKIPQIPYEKMWEDLQVWLPMILRGEVIDGAFVLNSEGKVVKHEISTRGRTPERKVV